MVVRFRTWSAWGSNQGFPCDAESTGNGSQGSASLEKGFPSIAKSAPWEARQQFEEVLKIDDQSDRARYRLAQLLLDEDPRLALDLLDQVLLRDPLQHGAAYNRALALRNLKKPEEARSAMARYQKILSGRSRIALLKERWALNPEEGSILLELGRVHRDLSVYGESLRWFARAGAAMPNASEPPRDGQHSASGRTHDRSGTTGPETWGNCDRPEAKKLLESFRAGSRKK